MYIFRILAANPQLAQKILQQAGQSGANSVQMTQAAYAAVQQAVQQHSVQQQNQSQAFNQDYINQVLGNLTKESSHTAPFYPIASPTEHTKVRFIER